MTEPGKLTIITGCMFAGKTTWLIKLISMSKNPMIFNHAIDLRYASGRIVSHDKSSIPAQGVSLVDDMRTFLEFRNFETKPDIFIDEGQFFNEDIIKFASEYCNVGFNVIIAGLDLDSNAKDFGSMRQLADLADEHIYLKAKCSEMKSGYKCNNQAIYTKRLVENRSTILVGGSEIYSPICWACHKL